MVNIIGQETEQGFHLWISNEDLAQLFTMLRNKHRSQGYLTKDWQWIYDKLKERYAQGKKV